MTKLEAVKKLVELVKIRAKPIDYDYDPAGSTTTYAPDLSCQEALILEALINRPLVEAELRFILSTKSPAAYYIPWEELIKEVTLSIARPAMMKLNVAEKEFTIRLQGSEVALVLAALRAFVEQPETHDLAKSVHNNIADQANAMFRRGRGK